MQTLDTTANPYEPFTARWRAFEQGANPHLYQSGIRRNLYREEAEFDGADGYLFGLADAYDEGAALRGQP